MTNNFYSLNTANGACYKENAKVAYCNEKAFSELRKYFLKKPTCLKKFYVLCQQNIKNSNKFQLNSLFYQSIKVLKTFDIKKLYQVVCMKSFEPTTFFEKDTLQTSNLYSTLKTTTKPSYISSKNNNNNQFITWLGWVLLFVVVFVAIIIAIWKILKKHRVSKVILKT